MKKNAIALSYLFSPSVVNELLLSKTSNKFIKILSEFNLLNILQEDITLKELFNKCYKELLSTYRNEYVFKNAIAQKILLGRHSIRSSRLFTEFRVETSKADVVIFNGTTHVYEIKTELDNFERLEKQVLNYKKVFEFINVVTVESKVETIKEKLDKEVGIIVLTEKYTFKTIRPAISNIGYLDKESLFNLLKKEEYLKIINKYFGYIPNVPNSMIYTSCLKKFLELDIEEAHKEVLINLKNRLDYFNLLDSIKKFPESLIVTILEANLSKKEQESFLKLLNKKITNIFL